MLLAIDIGNTNIVLGLYQGRKLVTHWRLATQAERTADEYGVIISQLIDYSGHRSQQISAIAVSCVSYGDRRTARVGRRAHHFSLPQLLHSPQHG